MAERSKATDCKSVKFYFTLVRIQPALFMRIWISEAFFFVSLVIFGNYLFIYPNTIIQFFIDQNNRDFFVSDLNLFTYRYTYTNFFFLYLVYAPFFYIKIFIWMNKCVSHTTYRIRIRILIMLRYTHICALSYNHLDFSKVNINQFIGFFESQITNIEFSYVLRQYSGAYWDFCSILIIYQSITLYFRESNSCLFYYEIKYVDYSFRIINNPLFWSNFYYIWSFRLIIFFTIVYFFCGEGRFSDSLVCITILVCIEFIVFTFRTCFIIKTYNVR